MTDIYFEVLSKFDKKIRTTKSHWRLITQIKHLEIEGKEEEVKDTLISPDVIRISQDDPKVFLYYKKTDKYYLCVVVRHTNSKGFIITCYLTTKLKEGKEIWRR